MNEKLTWLHLSDIHYTYDNFDTMRMRDMLLKKIEELAKKESFSFIVITGDLSYQGKIDSPNLTTFLDTLLDKVHLSKDSLFIVPGNHDVCRSSPRTATLKSFLSDKSSDFDTEMEQFMLEGFKNFNDFYKQYKVCDYPTDIVHWVYSGDKYNLIGLNTAITCGMDNEEGKLKIDSARLFDALKKIEKSDSLNIAIGHHGLDCFITKEANDTINQFEDYGVDLYLCGHVHKANYTVSADGNRNIPTITCGAAVVDDYSTAYFVLGAFDGETCKAKYFRWDKTHQQWIVDNSVSRKVDEHGFVSFKVNKKSLENEDCTFVDTDAFQEFIIGFHRNFELTNEIEVGVILKDISEKFKNMKCNKSMVTQYNKLSIYFPIITRIMNSPAFMSPKDKLIVPGVIIEAYNKNFDDHDTGHKILEEMVQEIYNNYKNKVNYPESILKLYIKILCYWFIYECDIFDDVKE